ncbi:MAG: DUF222 domain-containing protein [Propionicimonas sp.]
METTTGLMSTSAVLVEIVRLLGAVDHAARGWATDAERLEMLQMAVHVAGQGTALAQQLAGEVVATEAAEHAHGTSAGSWLAETTRLTRKEAAALLYAGRDLSRFPAVAAATLGGEVLPQQARAITRVLSDLPEDLPACVHNEAEELMVGYAEQFNSAELAQLSRHLLEVLAPEIAEASEAERLEREYQLAVRNRHLDFHHDGHGTTHLRGSFATVDAEALIQLVGSYGAQQKRALEAIDPLQPMPTRSQRQADGLMAIVHRHAQQALAPTHGGDRPRVVVMLDYEKLKERCIDARLLSVGESISAAALRQLACDADVLPAVLNGPTQPLDVGRAQRLVTGPIRAALELRDRGCAFPGCNRPPSACQAHHIIPWWMGGVTALWNLVLLCPHHHSIVEPGRNENAQRWTIELRADGVPQVRPPPYVDKARAPRIHTRYLSPARV